MDIDEVHKAIDYYIAHSRQWLPIALSIFAVAVSCSAIVVSLLRHRAQRRESLYAYLATVWNDLVNACLKRPKYTDIWITEEYFEKLTKDEALQYDSFCLKAWGLVEDIVAKKFDKDPQFRPVIDSIAAYHLTWLDRNPVFFTLERFWTRVESARCRPPLVIRYRPLPKKGDDPDWDIIAEDYHRYILGPFAGEMVAKNKSGRRRNALLDELLDRPKGDWEKLRIADFGCGPGGLIPFLAERATRLTGVDKSRRALEISVERAKAHNVNFVPREGDIVDIDLEERFDIIVCVNTILPPQRKDVVRMLRNIRDHLDAAGCLMAILPSFDTTEHLFDLWRKRYVSLLKRQKKTDAEAQGRRIVTALNAVKSVDKKNFTYADDGKTVQCYHTPDTIQREFEAAGLKLVRPPQKIYYPWSLTKRFDYGDFSETGEEEIWDWYVLARRA